MDNETRWWQRRWGRIGAALAVAAVAGTTVAVVVAGTEPDGDRAASVKAGATPSRAVAGTAGTAGKAGTAGTAGTAGGGAKADTDDTTGLVDADRVVVESSGSVSKDRRTMKVVSARTDLTGQRELAWIADAGEVVGTARCTRKFRIGAKTEPTERPTMLLCWRTSATRSAYTLAVDIDKRPSETVSVEALNKAWEKLG